MSKLRVYPHRVASPDSIRWEAWWARLNADSAVGLDSPLKGWDYLSALKIGSTVYVDFASVFHDTGLSDTDAIDVLILADCPQSGNRFTFQRSLQASRDCDKGIPIEVDIPSSQVAGLLRISGHIVVGKSVAQAAGQLTHRVGARLHSTPSERLILEGTAGRFPTEAADFSELGYGNAPWYVLMTFDELGDNFMNSVRLLINPQHPAGAAALHPTSGQRFAPLLRAEIVRSLVGRISTDSYSSISITDFEVESVASVANSMTLSVLGDGLIAACQLFKDEPWRFDLLLANSVDPIRALLEF